MHFDWTGGVRSAVGGLVAELLAGPRDHWRRASLGFVVSAARSTVEEQARGRGAVVEALVRRGLSADAVGDLHRGVYRLLARQDVVNRRVMFVLVAAGLAGIVVLWSAIDERFGDSHGSLGTLFFGLVGYLVVASPMALMDRPMMKLPVVAYVVGITAAAGYVVYDEWSGIGRVRSWIGTASGGDAFAYLVLQGVLTLGALVVTAVVTAPVARYFHRRMLLRHPLTHAFRAIFRSMVIATTDDDFLEVDSRRYLVQQLEDLSLIIGKVLWKTVRPPNAIARSVLKHRCALAGQAVEMLCVWVTLPARSTRADFLDKMCELAEAIWSGRLDELPVEPSRDAINIRSRLAPLIGFARTIVVGSVPLALLYASTRVGMSLPDNIKGHAWTLCWVWFVVSLFSALEEFRTGRTLVGHALELFSRAAGK